MLKLEKCNMKENKYKKYKKLLENADMGRSGYCLPPGIDVNITSPNGYPTTSALVIWFTRCRNITQIGKTNCYPPDVIEEKLKDVFIGGFLVDNYFDHNNLKDPAQLYVRYENMQAGASSFLFRQLMIELKNVDYFTDVNYLISNPEKVNYDIVAKVWERTTTIRQSIIPGAFCAISFNFGSIRQIYERKYYKLQNMLADLGGLVNALITLTLNINLYFSNKTFFNKIIDFNSNSLFIKSINMSLVENGGKGKQRDIKIIDKKGKTKGLDRNPQDQEGILFKSQEKIKISGQQNFDDPTIKKHGDSYDQDNYDPIKNDDFDKRSTKKLILKDKSLVSATEMVPKREKLDVSLHSCDSAVSDIRISKDKKLSNRENSGENRKIVDPTCKDISDILSVEKKIHINCCGYLLPAFCFKKNSQISRQLQLHKKFSDIINAQLDVLNISKKLHTVDKLNYVLCGEQFKNLLETTSNPYLYEGIVPDYTDIYEARNKIISYKDSEYFNDKHH